MSRRYTLGGKEVSESEYHAFWASPLGQARALAMAEELLAVEPQVRGIVMGSVASLDERTGEGCKWPRR